MKQYLFIMLLALSACEASRHTSATQPVSTLPSNTTINGKLYTALYVQRAAEFRALCFQAFNIAHWQIDQYKPQSSKPLAIITDIDETILDNSPYAVSQALEGKDYVATSWYNWTDLGAADTIPGAGSLLRYAASKGIETFYITNREERERSSTIANLAKLGLPNADATHLLTKSTTSGKEPRRQSVMATHEVIFLMGDNLADFTGLYDKKSMADRKAQTDAFFNEFGKRFIVLPNPNYGDWESSMNGYKYNYTTDQKDSIIRANVMPVRKP